MVAFKIIEKVLLIFSCFSSVVVLFTCDAYELVAGEAARDGVRLEWTEVRKAVSGGILFSCNVGPFDAVTRCVIFFYLFTVATGFAGIGFKSSRSMFSSRTLTLGSPNMPNCRPSV